MTYLPPRRVLLPFLLLGALIGALAGCAPGNALIRSGPSYDVSDQATVVVAPTLLLAKVPGVVKRDAFADGVFVGHLQMSGGYEVFETDQGMQYRSKNVEPTAEEKYGTQAQRLVDQLVTQLLTERGVTFRRLTALSPEAAPAPVRVDARGSSALDLRDNQNLPRFQLGPANAVDRAKLGELGADAKLLLVPMVVYYYSHNGGWFFGQTLGTGGGARFRVFWALYDLSSGAPVHWGDVESRFVDPRSYSPNSTQSEDYLLAVEKDVGKGVSSALLR